MKKTFTLKELVTIGWYTEEQTKELHSSYNRDVTSIEVLENKNLDLKDKMGFLYNSCGLTIEQKLELVHILVRSVAPIYNEKYPDDHSVNECWQAIDDFKNKLITKEQLSEKTEWMKDVFWLDDSSASNYAAIATFYAGSLAPCYCINSDPMNIMYYADAITYHTIEAALKSNDPIYPQLLNELMIDFVNKN